MSDYGPHYYDRDGMPISVEEWGRLHADDDYVRVGGDDIGPYWVSTVWLGLDHNFMESGPPLIFETMVFSKDQRDDPEYHGLTDIDCHRWSTLQTAIEGHQEVCTLVRATTLTELPEGSLRAGNEVEDD